MKRAKRLYVLLGVLVVVCIAAFAVVKHEERQEEIRNSGEIVLEMRDRSSGSPRRPSWTICTTPSPPGPTRIWP